MQHFTNQQMIEVQGVQKCQISSTLINGELYLGDLSYQKSAARLSALKLPGLDEDSDDCILTESLARFQAV